MIRKISPGQYEWTRRIRRRGSLADLRRLERRVDDALDQVGQQAILRDITIMDGLDDYLAGRADDDLAGCTMQKYHRTLMEIHAALNGRSLGDLTVPIIDELRHTLRQSNRPSTVNAKIDLLKRFSRWAARTNRWAVDPRFVDWLSIPSLRATRKKQRVLSIDRLVQVVDSLPPHVSELLNLTMLTAARPSAVLLANWSDVIWPDNGAPGVLRLPTLKRGVDGAVMFLADSEIYASLLRAREIFLACTTAAANTRPRYPRGGVYQDPLFVTRKSARRWTVSTLDHAVSHYLGRAGISGVTPYTIRRSIITAAWHLGGNAGEVKALAKHRHFATTEHYIIEDSSAMQMRARLGNEVATARGSECVDHQAISVQA